MSSLQGMGQVFEAECTGTRFEIIGFERKAALLLVNHSGSGGISK